MPGTRTKSTRGPKSKLPIIGEPDKIKTDKSSYCSTNALAIARQRLRCPKPKLSWLYIRMRWPPARRISVDFGLIFSRLPAANLGVYAILCLDMSHSVMIIYPQSRLVGKVTIFRIALRRFAGMSNALE